MKSIKELYEKVKSGEIDESKLEISIDSDTTYFSLDGESIRFTGKGERDVEELYKLLFPNAKVERC